MRRPLLAIGDVLPLPANFDIEAARTAQARRGITLRVANRKVRNQRTNGARKILAALEADRRRKSDPTEQAADFLRRKRFTVFRASVLCQTRRGWIAGRRSLPTDADLRAYAESLGWCPP